jgi:hypothetical protein
LLEFEDSTTSTSSTFETVKPPEESLKMYQHTLSTLVLLATSASSFPQVHHPIQLLWRKRARLPHGAYEHDHSPFAAILEWYVQMRARPRATQSTDPARVPGKAAAERLNFRKSTVVELARRGRSRSRRFAH